MRTIVGVISILFISNPLFPQISNRLNQQIDSIVSPLVATNNYGGVVLVSKKGEILHLKEK